LGVAARPSGGFDRHLGDAVLHSAWSENVPMTDAQITASGRGWNEIEAAVRQLPTTDVVSVAAHLVGTSRRWALAADRPYPAASTIKLAILVALFQEVDAGRLRLTDACLVDPDAVVPGTGVLFALQPGLTLPVADLAYLMVAISDNTASNLLLGLVGIERVRQTIGDLGMAATVLGRRFLGRSPATGAPENLTTATDLVTLLTAIAENRAASPAACARMRDLLARQQDRDRLARWLPADTPFGGKSGTLPALVHDSGLIETPAGMLAVAVLTRGFADPYAADAFIGEVALAMLDELED